MQLTQNVILHDNITSDGMEANSQTPGAAQKDFVSTETHSARDESKTELGEQYGEEDSTVQIGENKYSKVSVYLSMLFSGLAMGADG